VTASRGIPDRRRPHTAAGRRDVAAVIEQDDQGILTKWPIEAEALFGWTAAEAIGRSSNILVPVRNHARNVAALKAMAVGPDSQTHVRIITAIHRDGHEFPVEFTMTVSADPEGRRLVGAARRIAPQGRATDIAFTGANDRFRTMLDQIEDLCSVVDLRGRYLFVNEAFCRTFGRTKEEVLGTTFSASMAPEFAKDFLDVYMRVYKTGEPNRGFEFQHSAPDGSPRFFEQSVSLERDAEGSPIGFLAIIRDVTARKQAEREAARARESAEAANKAKSEFLANMSHEIRTPMNGIIGMTQLALDTDLTAFQQECLTTVRSSAESLLTILNDILDFSKIESRKLELESVPFTLADMVSDAMKPLAVQADRKGLEMIADIAPDVPAVIVGDPVRLKQVLTNLVGNAVKFTTHGHVVLSVRAQAKREDSVRLSFAVTDTGIGIPTEKHATIFESFSQADGSTTVRGHGPRPRDFVDPRSPDGRHNPTRKRTRQRQHVSVHD
jgi:PAS domain S-box-containing protein